MRYAITRTSIVDTPNALRAQNMPPIKIDLARLQQLTGPFVDELLSARRNLGLPTSLVSLTTDREELEQVNMPMELMDRRNGRLDYFGVQAAKHPVDVKVPVISQWLKAHQAVGPNQAAKPARVC